MASLISLGLLDLDEEASNHELEYVIWKCNGRGIRRPKLVQARDRYAVMHSSIEGEPIDFLNFHSRGLTVLPGMHFQRRLSTESLACQQVKACDESQYML